MSKTRRERCPHCGYLDVIRWGRQCGHQRYKCKNCGNLFTFCRKDISTNNRFVWFEWWILGKQAVPKISELSVYSERQLYRWFDEYLENYPGWTIRRKEKANLLIDGTWLPNEMCLIVYRDETIKTTLSYRLTDDEWEEQIREDIQNLVSIGIEIESVTSDVGRNIVKATKRACPDAVRQRCLAHIRRECLIWITKHPQSEAGQEQRNIVRMTCAIKTHNDRLQWTLDFKIGAIGIKNIWTIKLSRRPRTGNGIHIRWQDEPISISGKLCRTCFTFLTIPRIPKTTNALESFYGHLKENITPHRGMSFRHYQNYVKWYLYFSNKDNKKRDK